MKLTALLTNSIVITIGLFLLMSYLIQIDSGSISDAQKIEVWNIKSLESTTEPIALKMAVCADCGGYWRYRLAPTPVYTKRDLPSVSISSEKVHTFNILQLCSDKSINCLDNEI